MSNPAVNDDGRDPKRLRLQEATLESLLQQHSALSHNKLNFDLNAAMENQNVSDFPQILNQLKNSYRISSPTAQISQNSGTSLSTLSGIMSSPLNSSNPESDGKINELLKKLGLEPPGGHEDVLESLRLANAHLKKDNDKKEYLIQDLLKKLHETQEQVKMQAIQISELQMHQQQIQQVQGHHQQAHHQQMQSPQVQHQQMHQQLQEQQIQQRQMQQQQIQLQQQQMHHQQQHMQQLQQAHPQHSPTLVSLIDSPHSHFHQTQMMQPQNSPQMTHHAHSPQPEENMYKIPAQVNRARGESSSLELRVLQHPPNQAVYQRILRPFPTVAVMGVSSLGQANNLFVEVSLLKQDEHDAQAFYQGMYACKPNSPLEEKKNLIGGQLVQRSEAGSSPDSLIVVFRKLKILTTTAQQGGAFFLLKFVLKRYVDNQFETVPNVTCAISDPIEVFSHTLYLKGRPKTNSPSPRTAKRNAARAVKSEGDNSAAIAAATALMNARAHANANANSQMGGGISNASEHSTNMNSAVSSPTALQTSTTSLPMLSVSSILPTSEVSLVAHHGEDLSTLVAVSVGSV